MSLVIAKNIHLCSSYAGRIIEAFGILSSVQKMAAQSVKTYKRTYGGTLMIRTRALTNSN